MQETALPSTDGQDPEWFGVLEDAVNLSCSKAQVEGSGRGEGKGTCIHLACSLLNFLSHHASEDHL